MEDFNRTLRVPLEDDSPEGKALACLEAIESLREAMRAEGYDPDEYEIFVSDTETVPYLDENGICQGCGMNCTPEQCEKRRESESVSEEE